MPTALLLSCTLHQGLHTGTVDNTCLLKEALSGGARLLVLAAPAQC